MVILSLLFLAACQNINEERKRHVVFFKYKADATNEQIEKVTTVLGDLKNKIPGIVAFEHGVNDNPEIKT